MSTVVCFLKSDLAQKIRFYLMCDGDYYNCLQIVVHTADGFFNTTIDNCEDKDFIIKKITQLVLNLCKVFNKSGRVLNMDNYYTSPETFIALRAYRLFARGTC